MEFFGIQSFDCNTLKIFSGMTLLIKGHNLIFIYSLIYLYLTM